MDTKMPEINEIITGEEITRHYLDEDIASQHKEQTNEEYKIFRYNHKVYAVRYDETGPVDSISMWRSHKGEDISEFKSIGHGEFGEVYRKTPHKAVKVPKGEPTPEYGTHANLEILKQQFVLKEKDIEQHFILGLWNIKTGNRVHFHMPKPQKATFSKNSDTDKAKMDEFILALKDLNDSGYWHPDLANSYNHVSFQNLFFTPETTMALDLDSGFAYDDGTCDDRRRVFGRDQWIYLYNHIYPPMDEYYENERANWKDPIINWYEQNEGQALSDHPKVLLKFFKEGHLALPSKLVKELQNTYVNQGAEEYLSGKVKERKHGHREVGFEFFASRKHQEAYSGLKGDALKRTIINELKDSLEDITSRKDLEQMRLDFLASPQMQLLDKPQGKSTKLFHWKTDAHKAVDKIFRKAERRIEDLEGAREQKDDSKKHDPGMKM